MFERQRPRLGQHAARSSAFARHVLAGMSKPQKSISSQWLYDRRGSELFEEITELEEYYPTRTEIGILDSNANALADELGEGRVLVEFGSGSSIKTEILLAALRRPRAYLAIDISRSILELARVRLERNFPGLCVMTMVDDFTRLDALPSGLPTGHRLLFFPGSTIGNFDPLHAIALMNRFRGLLGPGGELLIGVDLKKPAEVLLPAYDDARGVTARFNLNLLARMNQELEGNFDLTTFRHEARYDARLGRIEMHLVSTRSQTISIMGEPFSFAKGESIHTENSYKHTIAGFSILAARSGLATRRSWTDARGFFGVFLLAQTDA